MSNQRKKTGSPRRRAHPPAKFKSERLPFHELTEAVFEEFTRRLCKIAFPDYERYELKEVRGRAQFGVDAECFNTDGNPETVLSAKCYEKTSVTATKIEEWVQDFIKNLDCHWKDKGVTRFILAVTNDGQKTQIDDKIRKVKANLRGRGISFEVWFNSKLHDLCITDENLVKEFFSPFWLEKYFSHYNVQIIDTRQPNSSIAGVKCSNLSHEEIEKLKKQNNNSVKDLLEAHIAERGKGNSEPLETYLDSLRDDPEQWSQLTIPLRAKVNRLMASLCLDNGNLEPASKFLQSARDLEELPDKVLPALISYHVDGLDAGLAELQTVSQQTEYELKAALLLENSDTIGATKLLDQADNTAEVFRLRSVLERKSRDYEAAIACARAALDKSPDSYGASLSLIHAHLAAALVPDANIPFGVAANPFNPHLAQESTEAQKHIADALSICQGVVTRSTGSQKRDAQSWQIALLLCLPSRQREGYDLVRELAESDEPDPLHVAWAFMINAPLKTGQLRKKIGDAIRKGIGTATHLVVLAMLMSTSQSDQTKAAATIERHKGRFPDQAAFLEQWQQQFVAEQAINKQRTIDGDTDSAIEIARSIIDSNNNLTAENLLVAAETLAAGNHWKQLDQLRFKLLRCLAPRFFQLAAIAALNVHNFSAAKEIVDQAAPLFPDCKLPAYFLSIRARALDGSGLALDAIEELVSLDKQSPQIDQRRAIIQKYLEIGHITDAARYSRMLSGMPDVELVDLVFAANLNADINPHFTKEITERLIASDDLPLEAVPHLLQLQQVVGTLKEEIQSKFRSLAQQFFGSEHVERIDSIEEALQKLSVISEEKRKLRLSWEQGGMISHKAFESSYQTFVELMLADFKGVHSEIGDWHPPILSTSGLPRKMSPKPMQEKQSLALDISGLILAKRFDLLAPLEQTFHLRIPRSTMPLLKHLLENWQINLDQSDIQLLQTFEYSRNENIEIIEEFPVDQIVLDRSYGEETLPAGLAALIDALFHSADLPDSQTLRLVNLLGMEVWKSKTPKQIVPEKIYITGGLLLILVLSKTLETASGLSQIIITRGELSYLKHAVQKSKTAHQRKLILQELNVFVRDKLDAGLWSLLPSPPCPGISQEELDRFPAENFLLASFWEVFNYGAQESNPLIWIEDRFLGRHNLSHVLTLKDILSVLSSSQSPKYKQMGAILDEFTDSGIGFAPVDLDVLLNEMVVSSKNSDRVCETENLKKLRTAFGRQAALIRYVDWDEQRRIDEEGSHIGELRFAKNFGFTLSSLLKKLWFGTELNEEQLINISNWAWRYLRLETIRPQDDESITQDKQLAMTAIILVNCAMQPFYHSFENSWDEVKYKPYLRWLFSHHLYQRLDIDKELRHVFIKQLISLFLALIEEDSLEDEYPQNSAHKIFIIRINCFLELFPDDLRNDILNTESFADRIMVHRNFVIHTQEGSFAVCDIADAINNEKKKSDLEIRIATYDQDDEAILTVKYDTEKLPSVKITKGSNEILLDDYAVMLSLDEAAERLRIFDHAEDTKYRGETWQTDARAILGADISLKERLERWHALRKNNFVDVLLNVEEQLNTGNSFSKFNLNMLPISSLLQYTKLDKESTDPNAAFKAALSELSREFGDAEAQQRLAAVALFGGFVDILPATKSNREGILGALLGSIKQDVSKHAIFLDKFGDELANYLHVFAALVRHGARQILVDPNYVRVQPWVRVFLCWVWASRLTDTLLCFEINARKFTEYVRQTENLGLHQTLYFNGAEPEFLSSALEATEEWFKLRVFQVFVSKRTNPLDINQDQSIMELVGTIDGNYLVPNAQHIFAEPSQRWPLAVYESFPGLIKRNIIDVEPVFLATASRDMPAKILSSIEATDDPTMWLTLTSLSQPGVFIPEELQTIVEYLERQLSSMVSANFDQQIMVLLRLYGRLTGETGDVAALKQILTRLIRLRFEEAEPPHIEEWISSDTTDYLFELSIDAAFAHAQHQAISIERKIELLTEIFEVILEAWPSSNLAMQHFLSNCIDKLPAAFAPPLWRLLESTRCR